MWPHHPRSQRLRELVAAGDLGPLIGPPGDVHVPARPADRPPLRRRGGGALFDGGIYVLGPAICLADAEPADGGGRGAGRAQRRRRRRGDGRLGRHGVVGRLVHGVDGGARSAASSRSVGRDGVVVVDAHFPGPERPGSLTILRQDGSRDEVDHAGANAYERMVTAFAAEAAGDAAPQWTPAQSIRLATTFDALHAATPGSEPLTVRKPHNRLATEPSLAALRSADGLVAGTAAGARRRAAGDPRRRCRCCVDAARRAAAGGRGGRDPRRRAGEGGRRAAAGLRGRRRRGARATPATRWGRCAPSVAQARRSAAARRRRRRRLRPRPRRRRVRHVPERVSDVRRAAGRRPSPSGVGGAGGQDPPRRRAATGPASRARRRSSCRSPRPPRARHRLDLGRGTVWAADATRGLPRWRRADPLGDRRRPSGRGHRRAGAALRSGSGSCRSSTASRRRSTASSCPTASPCCGRSSWSRCARATSCATPAAPRSGTRPTRCARRCVTPLGRVGEVLRADVDFRGAFTLDGVATADGFRPTELNPRFGAGLNVITRGLRTCRCRSCSTSSSPGDRSGIGAADLEAELLAAADASRSGGTLAAARARRRRSSTTAGSATTAPTGAGRRRRAGRRDGRRRPGLRPRPLRAGAHAGRPERRAAGGGLLALRRRRAGHDVGPLRPRRRRRQVLRASSRDA